MSREADLHEAELPPAESVADRGERRDSQQDVEAKSQDPHREVGVGAPRHGRVEGGRLVQLHLNGDSFYSLCAGGDSDVTLRCPLPRGLSYLRNGAVRNLKPHVIPGKEKDLDQKVLAALRQLPRYSLNIVKY